MFVRCCATAPVSFATCLEVVTSDGRSFRLPIAGTFDNSVLTTFAFLNATRRRADGQVVLQSDLEALDSLSNVGISAGGLFLSKRDTVVAGSSRAKLERFYAHYTSPGGVSLSRTAALAPAYASIATCLLAWLSDVITLSTPLSLPLPGAFIASHGKLLFELIQQLGGKKNLPLSFKSPPPGLDDRLLHMERQYVALLNFLRMRGAFLSALRPEFLFARSEFRRWQSIKLQNLKNGSCECYDKL